MGLVDLVRMPLCYCLTLRFQSRQEVCARVCVCRFVDPLFVSPSRHKGSLATDVAWLQQIQPLQEI